MKKLQPLAKSGRNILAVAVLLLGAVVSVEYAGFVFAGNLRSVNGSGEIRNVRLTVSAVDHSDETKADDVTGQAMFHDRHSNSKLSLEVTSVVINETDRMATVTGEVTKSTGIYGFHYPEGSTVCFLVEDNGEGGEAIPDGFAGPFASAKGCLAKIPQVRDDGGDLPAIEKGNFQVRGSDGMGEAIPEEK